jgi:hypothetical protein
MNSTTENRSLIALVTTMFVSNAAVALAVVQYGLLG